MAVNLGTRGVQEALRRCSSTATTPAAPRCPTCGARNGRREPYGIRLWCLGNEMDGPWQIGHKTAHEYGRLAAETARAMRQVDPAIELVACGSSQLARCRRSAPGRPTVLEHAYDAGRLHLPARLLRGASTATSASFLASAVDMDQFIDAVVATADHVGARLQQPTSGSTSPSTSGTSGTCSDCAGHTRHDWPRAPRLIEDTYTVADAVVVGSLLISLLRHSDRVTVACQAQLVNVIAPIRTEPGGPAWRQTIFHPFALTARLARGDGAAGRARARRPYDTARYGAVPVVDAVATHDEDTGDVTVFAVNRDLTEPVDLAVPLTAFPQLDVLGDLDDRRGGPVRIQHR